jgi:hypothetical protein
LPRIERVTSRSASQSRVSWTIGLAGASASSWRSISYSMRARRAEGVQVLDLGLGAELAPPAACIETLASQRKLPSSMLPSQMLEVLTRMARSLRRYATASSGLRMSGSLTISISGTPQRL